MIMKMNCSFCLNYNYNFFDIDFHSVRNITMLKILFQSLITNSMVYSANRLLLIRFFYIK